jgi:hypothetical protein
VVAAVTLLLNSSAAQVGSAPVGNNVFTHAREVALGHETRPVGRQSLSGGALFTILAENSEWRRRLATAQSAAPALPSFVGIHGCANTYTGSDGLTNTKVNQDCSQRPQDEAVIIVNPTNPRNLIAGQNDSRIGYNHCGYDWSMDGGKTWGDQIPPFYLFTLGDGHVADTCTDPTATFDAQGNAYVGGLLLEINGAPSAVVVAKSNAGINGAFYHSPATGTDQTKTDILGVVATDTDPNIANDKELMVADANPGSPKVNNVYMTWTRFRSPEGFNFDSPIFFSQSTDGGAIWSTGIEINGAGTFCNAFSLESNPNACDQDQGSDPIVGPDGTIYVTFNNVNSVRFPIGQYLVVKCAPTADCSNPASWSAPVRVTTDFALQPFGPDTSTGCPAGFNCLPPNGYRMGDATSGSVSIDRAGKLYFTWSDFRNGSSNCTGNAATATPPCNNDVFYAFSSDGGATWSAPTNVTPASKFGLTAQWMPWSAVKPGGSALWVAFYDRSYGNCETTGCNDITLAKVTSPAGTPNISYSRLTTASMPNLLPSNNDIQAGFIGDYMWVSVDATGAPYVVWADTRGLHGNVEEDIYFAKGRG